MWDDHEYQRAAETYRRARADFDAALRRGFWRSVIQWISQAKDNQLLPFEAVRKTLPTTGQHSLGVRQIPIDQIVGSVGRYRDFDRAFLPRQTRTMNRWIRIDQAHLGEVYLPPIEVYKIGDTYYVRDGNHRVSVARERGQAYIDADVTEIDVPVPVDVHTDIDTLIRRIEQNAFYRKTHLKELRPEAEIDLTVPGGYDKLIEHIQSHRWFMGEHRHGEISWEEAVAGWYDQVYQPLVKVIQEEDILHEFPDRTRADLYLWVIEHLWYLRQEWQGEVSFRDAATHFAEAYSQRPLRRILNLVRSTAHLFGEPEGGSKGANGAT